MLSASLVGGHMSSRSLALVALLSLPAMAQAGDVTLPADLQWCADTGDVLMAMPDANEATEGVIEAEGKAFGLRGTLTAIMEQDTLVNLRFRTFDTDSNLAAAKKSLTGSYGEGTFEDRSSKGGDRRLKMEWEVDAAQKVSLKVNSEQIYVSWEVDPSRCIEQETVQRGLTDAEKADIEANTKKKAIAFDPYAEKIEDVDARKKAADDAKKKAEKGEEAEEAEVKKDPNDTEIDW